MNRHAHWIPGLLVFLAGCATQQQMLQQRQPDAIQVALQRARFDMGCPTATATVLSSDFIQPAIQGPWVAGLQRLEYTIGVEGCGQRSTVIVMCQEGTQTCFAAHPHQQFGAAPEMPVANPGQGFGAPAPMPAAGSGESPALAACKADIQQFCSNVPVGDGRIKQCMKSHLSELSEQCKEALFQAWLRD